MMISIRLFITIVVFFIFAFSNSFATEKMTVTDDAKRTVKIPKNPQRIVVLNSSNLELLYAVGGKAVGRPESTGMPKYLFQKVKHLPSVGETPNPNIEKIVSLSPDLVIGVNVAFHHAIIPPLEKANIPVLLLSINSYQDILEKLSFYGEITSNRKKAQEIISEIEKKVSAIKNKTSSHKPPRLVIIWGSTESFNMALQNSFVGNLIEMLGAINVASGVQPLQSMPQYAPLSLEYLLANNPDIVLFITHGNSEKVSKKFKKEIENNSAWRGVKAVREGRVYVLPYDLFGVNPAVRVTEALDYIVRLLYPNLRR